MKAPLSNSMSETALSSNSAAVSFAFSIIFFDAEPIADPPTGTDRDPMVPPPVSIKSELPCTMEISSKAIPRDSQRICLKAVS